MTIYYLNCFTCNARFPRHWQSGQLCLLIESNDGLVLIDTGLGTRDYIHKPGILWAFKLVTIVPLNPEEAAIRRIARLGFQPEDVHHIVLTHMHFDHAGGLPDFPWAKVHVHKREYETFKSGKIRHWTDGGYNRRILDYGPDVELYEEMGETWYDFDAIRLPFEPEIYLLPLFGHTAGHCGVAVKDDDRWLLHVADAASFAEDAPDWAVRFVLGSHQPRLREFDKSHHEVRMTTGHMSLDFFTNLQP
ncbi:MAG: MBL fold metallo-hydrolase [Anaerolineales bacterium]|jgi:glyoxylase-like metal-dependent hydrolase (beta-lactamase superfamily II)